jgi:hypothetical protein
MTSNKSISFTGYFTQMHFFVLFDAAECFLLSSMAYDHMQPFVMLYSIQLLCPQGCAVPSLLETI